MNKKILITLFIIATILGVGVAWFFFQPKIALEDIMPDNLLFFAKAAHIEGNITAIEKSSFIKELSAIDIPKVMERNGYTDEKISQVKQIQARFKELASNPFLRKAISQEAGFAVFQKSSGNGAVQEIPYDVLIALRLPPSVAAAEYLGGLFKEWGKELINTKSQYRGITINHVTVAPKKITLAYIRVRDVLVVSLFSPQVLERVVDTYQRRAKSLSLNEGFIAVGKHAYPLVDAMAFVNMPLVSQEIKKQLVSWVGHQESSGVMIDDLMGSINSVSAYGFFYAPGEVNRFKMVSINNKDTLLSTSRHACSDQAGDVLRFIPANALGFNWSNCYNFSAYWQFVKDESSKGAWPQWAGSFVQKLEKRLRVNIADQLLPALGKEMGGYLTDVDTKGMFPYPRVLLFVKVKDQKLLEQVLAKATDNPWVDVDKELYGDKAIWYASLPLGANMDPAYVFLGDYLLVATSRQLLKKSIDAYDKPGRSLVEEKTFKLFGLGDNKGTHSITFMKTGDLAIRALGLLEWGNRFFTSQAALAMNYQEQGKQQQKEIAEEILLKQEDLRIAKEKIAELSVALPQGEEDEDALLKQSNIDSLKKDIEQIKEDIEERQLLSKKIQREILNYSMQLKESKSMVFNAENVLVPLFKGIGTLNAQGLRSLANDHFAEMELLVK